MESYRDLGWSPRVEAASPERLPDTTACSAAALLSGRAVIWRFYVHGAAKAGKRRVLSFVDIHDETIPDGVVLHGLKQRDGKFVVRIFGVGDNPKVEPAVWLGFGGDIGKLGAELWEGEDHSLWSAALYPEKDSIKEAGGRSAQPRRAVHGDGDLDTWKKAERKSLRSGFHAADPDAIIAWDRRMADLVAMTESPKPSGNRIPAQQLPKSKGLTKIQKQWLEAARPRVEFQ